MHAKITNIKRMIGRYCPSSHNCCNDRNIRLLYQLCKHFICMSNIDTATGKEQRAFRLAEHLDRTLQLSDMYMCIRLITTNIYFLRIFCTSKLTHHILRKIYQYWSRSSGSCNVECLLDNTSQVLSVSHCHSIFRNASRNSYNIYFLKSIISDKMSCHLTSKTYKRYAVIICCCKSRHKICRARSACHKAYAHFSGRTCICIGLMDKSDLLSRENDLCIVLFVQFITDIDRTCPRITKERIYPFLSQCFYQ